MIATNRVGIVFKCSPTVSYLHFESALRVFWITHTQTRKKRNIKLTTTPYKHRPPKRPKKGHIGRTGPGASIIIGGAGCGHQFGNKQTIICCRARFRDNHHHKSCLQLWTQSLAILSLIGERLLKVFWLKVFLAALAALYLTLVSEWLTQWLTATLEFQHKEWLSRLQTLQTFDRSEK